MRVGASIPAMAANSTTSTRAPLTVERIVPRLAAAAWAMLPVTAGPALAAGLDPRSGAVRTTGSVGLWAIWGIALLAHLVPHPLALTAVRVAAPAGVVAAILTSVGAHPASTIQAGLAVASAVIAALLAFAPAVGERAVNGPAYPNERRFPLRVPALLVIGPLPLAWALAVGTPVAAAFLLAAQRWIAGAVAAVVGVILATLLGRSLHQLSRRWLVFVPAGLVLHDFLTLGQPVLFPRRMIETLRPAPVDSDSLDLTQRALGLALELVLLEKVPMTLQKPGRRWGEEGASARLLCTPVRPGRVLQEAALRRIPTA